MGKNFNFNDVKPQLVNKMRLVKRLGNTEFETFYNGFSFPYRLDELKNFLVEDERLRLTKYSMYQYLKYLRYLLRGDKYFDYMKQEVIENEYIHISLAEIVVLLPCIFSVDTKHDLGKKTIELLCSRLAKKAENKGDIRNARSALRKYSLFLEQCDVYKKIPNINDKIKGLLQSITAKEPFTYDYKELCDKLSFSMWTQDRLKQSEKGICYPIRLIGSLLTKKEKDSLMKSCIDNIRIYRKKGETPEYYTVRQLSYHNWKLLLKGGNVILFKGKDDTEIVYDCEGEKLKAYVGSDISIEHEYSIANILEDDTKSFPHLTKLSELIWEICDNSNPKISVNNANAKRIYDLLKEKKMKDLNRLKENVVEELKKILYDTNIKLSLMNTAKNSRKGKHD